MAKYQFSAIRESTGQKVRATLEAPDRLNAINVIKAEGLKLIKLNEVAGDKGDKGLNITIFKQSIKPEELVMFTRQLSAMISAGVHITRALNSMSTYSQNPTFKEAIRVVSSDVEGGRSLADALAQHPDIFDTVYVNMVRAGEAAGILDEILKRLALQQEKSSKMRRKIKGAMTYPLVLIVITFGAFLGLMMFIIPMIGKSIKELGGDDAELPALTQAMLGLSDFLVAYWYIIIPAIIGGVWLFLRYIKTPAGKSQFDKTIIRLPIFGKLIKKVAVARFTRTFSSLSGAGVTLLESLTITSRAIGNTVYEKSLQNATARIKNGENLSDIISDEEDLYPPLVYQMLAVGEETGQTEKVLVKVADFYEDEVDIAVGSLSSTIEPIMIVVMGGVVGIIAASVMMPIAGLANQIKG